MSSTNEQMSSTNEQTHVSWPMSEGKSKLKKLMQMKTQILHVIHVFWDNANIVLMTTCPTMIAF